MTTKNSLPVKLTLFSGLNVTRTIGDRELTITQSDAGEGEDRSIQLDTADQRKLKSFMDQIGDPKTWLLTITEKIPVPEEMTLPSGTSIQRESRNLILTNQSNLTGKHSSIELTF